jgi:hypothetical protein
MTPTSPIQAAADRRHVGALICQQARPDQIARAYLAAFGGSKCRELAVALIDADAASLREPDRLRAGGGL